MKREAPNRASILPGEGIILTSGLFVCVFGPRAGGAAAGVAASFHAPIAGVLMTQNEGSSFWTNRITIRSFLCAMVSMFTLTVYLNDWSPYIYSKSLITFGSRSSTDQPFGYHAVEIIFFGLLGIVGGVLGGLFARCNAFVWRVRAHVLRRHRGRKIVDAIIMAIVTAAIFVFLPHVTATLPGALFGRTHPPIRDCSLA